MPETNIANWLSGFLGPGRTYPTAHHLAQAAGVATRTVNHLAATGRASPETLILIADTVGTPRLEVFVIAGWLRPEDLPAPRQGSENMLTPHHKPLMAFDLEIATTIQGSISMPPKEPLGITCAAVWTEGNPQPLLAWGGRATGEHAPRMTRAEARDLLHDIRALAQNHRLTTWNGTGFDLPVLGAEAGDLATARQLAAGHIDMMLHVLAVKGWPIGLNAAAKGMSLPGKAEGTAGAEAPELWAQGHHQQVIDYCSQDARTTLDVALAGEDRQLLTWRSQSGRAHSLPLEQGWLTVPEALAQPTPDTPWIKEPVRRETFTAWLFPHN